MTQETDLDPRNYVYLVALAPAILVTHAFAVRLSRAVELTGRLQGRSTVNLLSGGLSVLNLVITTAVCRRPDIPLGIDAGAGAIDIALSVSSLCCWRSVCLSPPEPRCRSSRNDGGRTKPTSEQPARGSHDRDEVLLAVGVLLFAVVTLSALCS